MAPINDPYHWSVDQVASALCAGSRPWVLDATELEAKIREEQLDGSTLLTYEKLFSEKELLDILGIKTARRRALLARYLVSLRTRVSSPAYRSWLANFEADLGANDTEPLSSEVSAPPIAGLATNAVKHQVNGLGDQEHVDGHSKGTVREIQTETLLDFDHSNRLQAYDEHVTRGTRLEPDTATADARNPQADIPMPAEGKRKQKRVAPTVVDSSFDSKEMPWERAMAEGTYIGPGSILDLEIFNLKKRSSAWLVEGSDDEFDYMPPKRRIPPGRRQAVNRVMQRFLRTGRKPIYDAQQPESVPQTADDPIIDTFSDLGDGDESQSSWARQEEVDIAAEREDERQELEAYMKRNGLVTKDRIQAIIGEEVGRITTEWRERKANALGRKAHGLWSASRRRGTKTEDVFRARRQAQMYDQRIQRMSDEIMSNSYTDEKEIRWSAVSLEPSVEDRLYQRWLANTLDSDTTPPRPETIPKLQKQTRKTIADDPELIVSSDEDDFIIDDEDDAPAIIDDTDIVMYDSGEEAVATADPQRREGGTDGILNVENNPAPGLPTADRDMVDLRGAEDPVGPSQESLAGSTATNHRQTPNRDLAVKEERRPPALAGNNKAPVVVDLTTPTKPTSSAPKKGNPLFVEMRDEAPSLDALTADGLDKMVKAGARHWAKYEDRHKLVICMLDELDFDQRSAVFKMLKENPPDMVWRISVLTFLTDPPANVDELQDGQSKTNLEIVRIFTAFLRCRHITSAKMVDPSRRTLDKIEENKTPHFQRFCLFVVELESIFPDESQIYRPDLVDNEFEDEFYDAVEDEDELEAADATQKSKTGSKSRPKEVVRNKDAVDLRLYQQQRVKDQEARREKLRENLANSSLSHDKSRLIVNMSKDEEQSLIYINEQIGKTIKDHQIEGVRFFWNQTITDLDTRQGCLLSHTMGLGKTMQVITFLVAIADAARSSDASVRSQIPKDLRALRTLILCPAGLVDNWMDELIKWAPHGSLGSLWQVDSQAEPEDRLAIIDTWATGGGLLLMGYTLFQKLANRAPIGDQSPGNKDERVAQRLLETPNIVVADEAHFMKNLNGKLNQACHKLRTPTRLALTGSPLANHVEEYYAMIDWVAPNFLGPLQEFNQIYANVIEQGLARDSSSIDKRRASKMLQVLKETVEPKVHRATTKTSSLATDLPPKAEFMISIPPTELQEDLYNMYISGIAESGQGAGPLNLIYPLGVICAHPMCFRRKVIKIKKALAQNLATAEEDFKSFPQKIIQAVLERTTGLDDNPLSSNKVQFLITILDEARELDDKVLVFTHSLETLNYLENLLSVVQKRKVRRLDGATKVADRQRMIKSFNDGDAEVYLISTTAGGVGLNIHGANRVVLFDTSWNPVNEQQAVGRTYRIGQKKPVFVYHLKIAGSFEETLQDQAIFKTQLQQRVVDKQNPVSWGKRRGHYDQHLKEPKWTDLSAFKKKDRILDSLLKKPPGGVRITKILHTDTLEEEDPTQSLTTEEMEEATQLVKLNELRRTNPAEWARQKEQIERKTAFREMAYAAQQPQSVTMPQSQASPYPSTPVPLPTHAATNDRAAGAFPSSAPPQAPAIPGLSNYAGEAARPLPEASGTSTPSHQPQTPQSESERAHSSTSAQTAGNFAKDAGKRSLTETERPPSTGPAPRILLPRPSFAPALGPVMGANTFFGQPQRAFTPIRSASQPQQVDFTSPSRGGLFSQPQIQQKGRFHEKLTERVAALLQPTLGFEAGRKIVDTMTSSIEDEMAQKDRGFLPDNQQWQLLTEMLDYENFVLGTVAGMISARFLASGTQVQLKDRLQTLNDLPKEQFRARLAAKRLSEEPSARRASNSNRTSRLAADEQARQQRRPRLPPWAVSTIISGSDRESVASRDDARTPRPYA